jgi:hypothetical protein
MKNIDIDYKILAKHFGRTRQSMHLLKSKWKKSQPSLWEVYVKAYYYDIGRGL